MNANNNAKRATIAEIQGKFFEIPPYQRLYAWGEMEINTLLDDMKKACELDKKDGKVEDKKEYFIGNITTSIKSENEQKIYVLIDGQQRLTTLWFIGFYLASQNCPNWKEFIMQGENLRIAMPIRDNEENALTKLAKNINGKENLAQSLQGYGVYQNIIDAFKCIESWFVNGNGKNIDLANFAKDIYENICFVFVTLAQNTDLNRFFVRMNNRGKQLEKHEILKARVLGEIRKVYDKNNKLKQDESDEIWKKYAKIWDLCSDMDKYIFQSASDRSILKSKSQNENSAESSNNNDSLVKIADIVEKYKIPEANKSKEKDSPSKVESIIDFPTFLLHCYKLWVAKKFGDKANKITISKDKLLEIMWENKDSDKKEILCDEFIFDSKNGANEKAKQNCKEFIIDMLHYRVLFDYFVIKNTLGDDGFAIMRFYESNGSYQPKAKSFENLAMIQNYLRVARQGERQNYHHWLTPFLKFLDKHIRLDMNLALDDTKEFKFDDFKDNAEKIANQFSNINKCEGREKVLVRFLENLDTKLATHQLGENNEKNLLDATNSVLKDLKVGLNDDEQKLAENFSNLEKWDFLNGGTATPHYWFYRLEYYLWKWGSQKDKINNDKIKNIFAKFDSLEFPNGDKFKFEKILSVFYFRNLNSVEHIETQSNFRKEYKWTEENIDNFGNLALISPAFNSQLSNQSNKHKALDLRKKIDDGNAESLKLWLVYAQYIKDGDKWTCGNAKRHLIQMLKILKESLGLNPKDS